MSHGKDKPDLWALIKNVLFLMPLFGVLLAIATGGSSLTISVLLARWFDRQRATAVALNAAGASVGGCCSFLSPSISSTSWLAHGYLVVLCRQWL